MAKKPVARSVESLKVLLSQINKLAPNRSKASDGWIGDAKHQSRHSDHNPEPDGTVDARDFTNDPTNGMDSQKLADAIVASRDPRLSYIICNGKIVAGRKGPKPWQWRKYNGSNGHYHHIHVSVLDEGQDDKTPWQIESAFKKAPGENLTEDEVGSVLKIGSKGRFVEYLQWNLKTLGYGPIVVNGEFDEATENAVKRFQRGHGLEDDGWAGPKTHASIGEALEKKKLQPKIEAANEIIDDAAGHDRVTVTEWLSGIFGVGGTVSVGKQVVDGATEASRSIGDLVTTLGPWVLLGLVILAGAGYIIYDRRKKRLQAARLKKEMRLV